MNKLVCLLLFPFALTQPLTPAPAAVAAPPLGPLVLPAAPPPDWALPTRPGAAPAWPSAIRALARLLRAYTEPAQSEPAAGLTTSAPFPPFFLHHA